jgi:small subunit ribosomal protein S13
MFKYKNISFAENFVRSNYGVGIQIIKKLFKNLGLNNRLKPLTLKKKHSNGVNKQIQSITIGKKLKDKSKNIINFLIINKTYKGIRHKLKFPVRGQRTHTNAKTRKKITY